MPAITGTITDPDFRHARAKLAAKSRTSLQHHIRKVVENAHKLSAEDVETLRGLLPAPSADGGGPRAA